MIKAIAVDDEPPALNVIRNFCSKIPFLTLEKTFTRPSEAEKYIRKFPVDLILLDIQMPSVSGIDFYKSITQNLMVIFTTAYSEYAVEGFNCSAVDYLLKPYTFERFMKAAQKAEDYFNYLHQNDQAAGSYIFVRADYSLVKIKISEIIFIQGLDDYVKIHLTEDRVIVARMTLKSLHEKLPAREFVRVHRSFIVSLSKVDKIRNKNVIIGKIEIPVGLSYEEVINLYFKI